jgi:hypothetical protein
MKSIRVHRALLAAIVSILALAVATPGGADETCNSPHMGNLIKGQEDDLYVWALGVQGMGDGMDKLATIDVNPASGQYGKVIHKVSAKSRGEAHHMGFTDDRRFIYTSCADPRGCPLTTQVFHTVRHRVSEDPALRTRVRLVSLSFDPARDTPATMRRYAADVPVNGVEWAFLTTEQPRTLVPLLDGFGQDVRVELDARGRPAGPLAHVLKVFLIDERAVVREIYTTSYLFPEVILNDIKTLRLENGARRRAGP